ncbi:type IV conjugative transfer system coupling protein TraD [Vibrio pectenicida]|uniref:type IV conjugative transfer system coupling protein TraD n=1 Tax=Vibrio pectenicida TaxID=62763 RepID=UPI003B99BA85
MPTHTQSNHVTRGGQITFHSIHMFFQVHNKLAKIISIGVLLCSVLFTWILSPDNAWQAVFYTLRNHLYDALNMAHDANVTTFWNGQRYVSTLGEQLNNAELGQLYDAVIYRFQVAFLIAFFMGMATFISITLYFKRQGEKQSEDRHIRGFQLVDPKTMSQDIKARAKRKRRQGVGNGRVSSFRIDGHALFKMHFEVQHCLFDGTTGAGKSVGMRKLVNWIRARGDKAVIYDKGCTFTSEYFDASTDTLLNPFDKRCANWDIWCDAFEAPDFESMASALIPQHGDGDPFWVESARTIFSSTAYRMMKDTQGECTTERLLHLMLTSELETLGTYLKGTESASLVSDKIQKTAISIKSVLATYIKSLRFLDGLESQPNDEGQARQTFSITRWIQDDNQKGCLFLSSAAEQHASLRPLISMWLAIASNAILGLKPDDNRRVWVLMDEMPSLHRLPELGSIISEVRKFGGCYVIGIQSYAQLEKTYGKTAAQEMFDLLNTRFFFRAPSNAMASISSKELGEQEVDLSKENISYGANALRDGVNIGHETKMRPIVTASEIQALDDLECYLRVPGSAYVTKLDLFYDKLKNPNPGFIKREFTTSPGMVSAYEKAVFLETVAPGLYLSDKDRQSLTAIQASQFETDEEMKIETNQMNEAQKGDTFKAILTNEKGGQSEIEKVSNSEYQAQAQRQLDEAAISQDIGEMGD